MSYRFSQLSPQGTNGSNVRISVQGPRSTRPERFRDMQFWRSWLELDSEIEQTAKPSRVNWNAVLGVAVTLGISAAFWTGVGVAVAQIWK
jgi:hypothetical protein